tara:strand:- start:2552 stop:3541 length:990 start_codon:yes stop_codon:yes gene_type:complete
VKIAQLSPNQKIYLRIKTKTMDYNYAYKTNQAVFELTELTLEFCQTNQSYLINDKLANTYINSYYNEQVDNIKELLHHQLKTGRNHKAYLENLLGILEKRIEWLHKMKYKSVDFFNNCSIKTIPSSYFPPVGTSNKISFKNFLNDSIVPNSQEQKVLWFLQSYEEEFNHYENKLDFEKGLVLYVMSLYKRALSILCNYVKTIYEQVDFIDFNKLSNELLSETNPRQKKERNCNINLDKKSVAHLFRILLEEDFLVFDELNEANNRLELKRFVENNFNYQNTKKERLPIKSFNREYSEVSSPSSPEVKKHKEFIDKLILMLQARKNKIKD